MEEIKREESVRGIEKEIRGDLQRNECSHDDR